MVLLVQADDTVFVRCLLQQWLCCHASIMSVLVCMSDSGEAPDARQRQECQQTSSLQELSGIDLPVLSSCESHHLDIAASQPCCEPYHSVQVTYCTYIFLIGDLDVLISAEAADIYMGTDYMGLCWSQKNRHRTTPELHINKNRGTC